MSEKKKHQELTVQELLAIIEWATNALKSIVEQNPDSGTVKAMEGTNPNPPLPPKP